MMSSPSIAGKNVFITGAGSGFGRAAARRFAEEGAGTLFVVDLLPDRLDVVTQEVEKLGASAVPIVCNVGEVEACERAVERALAIGQHVDVLISNAAALRHAEPFLELRDAAWNEEVAINLTASFVLGQRIARAMTRTGGGVILYTASVNALGAGRGFASYCATKAGIVALVKVMAVELAALNIRVNAVSPGPADTPRSVDLVGEDTMEKFRKSFPAVPMNRLASAEDIANAFLFLASDQAAYITGQNLVVDGGLTAQIYDVPRD